jgi:hypothetical protein
MNIEQVCYSLQDLQTSIGTAKFIPAVYRAGRQGNQLKKLSRSWKRRHWSVLLATKEQELETEASRKIKENLCQMEMAEAGAKGE